MVDLLIPPQHQPSQPAEHIEMDASISRSSSRQRLLESQPRPRPAIQRGALAGVARHTLGLILLLCVVFLWTLSNFLGSSIFADNTYAKPFFLTYLNTSMFMLAMIPTLLRSAYKRHRDYGNLHGTIRSAISGRWSYRPLNNDPIDSEDSESETFIKPNRTTPLNEESQNVDERDKHLGLIPTARLSLAFCFLWFGANYFAMACLQYTTVASTTILTSTSSFWTLLIGAFTRTEKFTWRKFCGVLASFVGIILISRVDLTASANNEPTDPPTGRRWRSFSVRSLDTFPEKPPSELALGDALALLSAIIYGVYTITLKKSTIKALPRSLNMPLFFGLVGMFNLLLLFPLFPILHFTGLEKFSLPPTRRIWTILLVNSVSSFFSDICWAYAMVLTSPLLVTVGLSLTIPLSLVGEMVLQGHYEGWMYWLGAGIVVGSFLFVDHEEREEETDSDPQGRDGHGDGPFQVDRAEGDGLIIAVSNEDRRARVPLAQNKAPKQSSGGQGQQGRSWWDRFRSTGSGSGSSGDDDFLLDDGDSS
ncbi:uncharacterized protein Z518_02911 [Rhinocladiella mackenziei CBS 650.93]|uniref:Rhinocladiella mackenziei CBS 650.93 unplaced genomic scaffold supercont1.2, whole genome shotgun sequence n=1 Tax=Rhinocladiella mackenziei CBS 650.93 TaxID=1442369 RepID=A0A0D2JFZ9_9EURO|nr:uncharacterized protein Z518_02911 [Rhinocladiella mackenziei CBS 650.93]KIX08255.1 hypothetical protein Z518_02911 [Rhinocladiella mackenziei CBS 650.93]